MMTPEEMADRALIVMLGSDNKLKRIDPNGYLFEMRNEQRFILDEIDDPLNGTGIPSEVLQMINEITHAMLSEALDWWASIARPVEPCGQGQEMGTGERKVKDGN